MFSASPLLYISFWAEQDKAVVLINKGLAAIEEAQANAIAANRAERDRGIAAVKESAESEMASLKTAAEKSLEIISG